MRRLLMYDRLGNPLGELPEADVFEAILRETINGEHSLEITTTHVLDKGIRLLYQDGRSKWREFVVAGIDAEHASGNRAIGTYYCVWSVQSDLQGVTVSVMPGVQADVTAATALDALLSTTARWSRGTVTQTTLAGASMYDRSAWEALSTLVEVWGGEVDATIQVGTQTGVTGRLVDLYAAQGNQTAMRRFDFGHDLKSVKRTFADNPLYCRISPRGAGEETDAGGYGRKITIESVNDGKDYLVYDPMVDAAKLPATGGTYEYPTLIVENSNCKTPADLLTWAQSVLAKYCTPEVTYDVDVLQAGIEGVDVSGVSLGDAVQVVDRKFSPDGLRVEGRVYSITTDLLNERDISIQIGAGNESVSSKFASVDKAIAVVNNDLTKMSTAQYIDDLVGRINAEINATGGYTYIVPGNGILTYDVAVADPLNPVEASQVVEIKGGSIRIANSKTAQGEWNWRTVFVSGHIAADLVTAANITTGFIGNVAGDNYWDLDGDSMHISGDLTLKSRHTIAEGSTTYVRAITKNGVVTVADFNDYYRLTGSTASVTNYCQGLLASLYNDAETTEYSEIMLLPSRYQTTSYWSSIACNQALHILGYYAGQTYTHLDLGYSTAGLYSESRSGSSDSTNSSVTVQAGGKAQVSGSPVKLYVMSSSSDVEIQFSGNTYNKYTFTSSQFNVGYSTSLTAKLQVYGNQTVTGTKSRLVDTEYYNDRLLYAYEMPSPMFGDIGSGTIGDDGLCYVEIDDIFSETARADIAYQVFLQKCGDGDLYVESKSSTHFVVRGTPGLNFDWEIKCKQRDYEALRMEQPDLDPADMHGVEIDDGAFDYLDYVTEIENAYS